MLPLLCLPDASAPRDLVVARRAYAGVVLRLLGAARGEAARTVLTRIGQISRRAPDVVVELVCEPMVAVLAHCGRLDAALRQLAAEMAWRRLLPDPVTFVAAEAWSVCSPERGERHTFAAGARVTFASDEPPRGRVTRDFVRVDADSVLALFDPNPLSHLEEHPEKQGNALSLGGHPVEAWTRALGEALAIIEKHLPAVRAELRAGQRLYIPVGYEAEKHLSASYREYVGAIYLTLHPQALTLAEAIVHEFQHGKINLLSHLDPLLENGFTFRYRSPVRPDPRPLMGILLAAHAFVPVAHLLHAAGEPGAARLADVVAKNDEALAVLRAHAMPTALGKAIMDELERLHAPLAPLRRGDGVHEA